MSAQAEPVALNSETEVAFPPGIASKISVLDWGFLRSDATYDVVHVWQRRFFRLDKHLDRFLASTEALKLTLPFDRERLAEILTECVRRSGLDDVYVEMICTRGFSPTFSRDPRDAINRFIAFAIPFSWIATEEQRARGLDIAIGSAVRIPPESVDPRVKNYHWMDLVAGLYEAYETGAENVVLCDRDGNLTEGPGFNIFAVKDGRVVTPDRGVLEGITRRTALDLCELAQIPAEEARLSVEALMTADEVFLTSTAGGIVPITRIDGAAIGAGTPGPVTARLVELYWQKHEDPAWTTPVD
jgi:branched-chain amino acid aminotransferase